MNIRNIMKGFIVVLAIAGVLVACSSSSGAKTTVSVDLTDFHFKPDTFTVPAGKEITVNVANKGANVHEFVIMKAGAKVTPPFDDDDEGNIYWELDDVDPGATKSGKFTLPEAGTYQVVCGTPSHIEQGMVGTLTVTKE